MKILLVSYMEPGAPCGVRAYYQLLQKGLESEGHEVRVITPACAPCFARLLTGGIRRVLGAGGAYANLIAHELKCWWRIRAAVRSMRWRPDLIHGQDVGSATAALAGCPTCPVLVTAHFNVDPVEEILNSCNLIGHPARWLRRRFRRQFSTIQNYVAPSRHAATCLRRWAPAASEITVVPNACDIPAIDAVKPAEDVLAVAGGRKVILSAGTLESRKDPGFLIELAAALSARDDLVLMHAGDGPLRGEMEAAVTARKLTNVRLLGHRTDLAAVMKSAWLFIHFPLRETFGLVVIEAMAAGVPVLARRVGGIPDILSVLEAQSLYDVNTSPAGLGRDIAALADDPRRLKHLAAEQYRVVCSRFDKPVFLRTMTALYQRLLCSPAPSA